MYTMFGMLDPDIRVRELSGLWLPALLCGLGVLCRVKPEALNAFLVAFRWDTASNEWDYSQKAIKARGKIFSSACFIAASIMLVAWYFDI